jgi:hypothetical protein
VLATDGTLRTFNVHTGNLVTPPYATGATSVGAMAISSDGTKLFVTDTGATPRTIVLNAWSLAQSIAAVYPTVAASTVTDNRFGVVFSRPNGHPMLWSAFDSLSSFEPPVDVETSQRLDVFASGLKLTTGPGGSSPSLDPGRRASPDGRYFYAWSLTSLIRVQFHRFSMLGGPRLELDPGTRYDFFNIVGGVSDYCVDPTNRVHVLRDGDVSVQQFDFSGELDTVDLPLTDPGYVIHCGWNGRVYVGRPSGASEHNVVVLDESGAVVSTYRHGPAAHLFVGYQLALSGDETRLVWPGISTGGTAVLAISSVP